MLFNLILGWIILVIIPFVFLKKIKPENTAYIKDKRFICLILLGFFALGIFSSIFSILQLRLEFGFPQFLSLWGFLPIIMESLYKFLTKIGLLSIVSAIVSLLPLLLAILFSIVMIIFFVKKIKQINVKQIMKEFTSFDVSNKNEKQNREPMVRFVRKAFQNSLEIILWINLIVFTVGGWNTGKKIKDILEFLMEIVGRKYFNVSVSGYPFLGAFLGILVGLLVNVILGGFIATITNIDKNLEILTGKSSEKEKLPSENSYKIKKSLIINDNSIRKEGQAERKTDITSGKETINNNTGKTKLIILRENNFLCSSILFDIFIDNKKAISIKNASKFSGFIKNGIHSIYAAIDNNTKSEIIKFNTVNPEIKFRIRVLEIGKIKLEKII